MLTFPKRHTSSPLGHSADVELWLHLNGEKISLTHTCGTWVRLEHDQQIQPGPGKVEVIVDGVSHMSDVTVTGKRADGHCVDILNLKSPAIQPRVA